MFSRLPQALITSAASGAPAAAAPARPETGAWPGTAALPPWPSGQPLVRPASSATGMLSKCLHQLCKRVGLRRNHCRRDCRPLTWGIHVICLELSSMAEGPLVHIQH